MHAPPVDLVKGLFPANVYVAVSDNPQMASELHAEEASATGQMVEKRLREFRHGRHVAREALASLGKTAAGVPKQADRSPQWPAGIVGSISHCKELAAAVVGKTDTFRGLGLDIETDDPLPPDVANLICRPEEPHSGDLAKVLFSAKESIYKCLFPEVQAYFDFQDMQVRLEPAVQGRGEFRAVAHTEAFPAELADSLRGRYCLQSGRVYCAAWLPAADR